MNKSGLVTRLAVIITFAAAVVGFLSTQVFYRITYNHELEISKQEIEQLHTTVSATTSIASYLEDEELLREAVKGLASNNVISHVRIETDNLHISSDNKALNEDSMVFELFSPFEADRNVGSLTISPDFVYIRNRASQISTDNSIAIAVQAAIVTLVVIFVSISVITNPIIKIAKQLHQITPGNTARLDIPSNHQHSEIGDLVTDINYVLTKSELHLIDERKLRSEVERLSKHFQMLFEHSTSPIVLMEPKGDLLLYNKAFIELLKRINVPFKKNFGNYLSELFVDGKLLDNVVQVAFGNNEIASGEFKLIKDKTKTPPENNDKKEVWVQAIISSNVLEDYKEYYQVTLHDISKRKLQLDDLDHKASTDPLTQLLNRRGTEQTLTKFINNRTPFALVLLDLNKFKPVNDIYGHDAGDELLIHVATQLINTLRRRDLLSRWGGDEFIIILPNLAQAEVIDVTKKINAAIISAYTLKNTQTQVSIGASMGVSFYPHDHKTLEGLIAAADKAMYWAKSSPLKNASHACCLYSDYLNREQVEPDND